MKFGVCIPNYGTAAAPDAVKSVSQLAESLGYHSIWVTDHLLVPEIHAPTFGNTLEALVTLGYLAGVTERVKLASSILVLPQRDPILVAKQAAAIDLFSNGRLQLGVGVGWMSEEYRYLRSDFHKRGRMADEWITVMRHLWTGTNPLHFNGKWIQFAEAVFAPQPLQENGPPIYIGGNSEAALKRAATLGDGWHPSGMGIDDFRERMAQLKKMETARPLHISLRARVYLDGEAISYRGGEIRRFTLGGTAAELIAQIKAFADAGLEELVCYFPQETAADLEEQIQSFATAIFPSF